MRSNIERQNSEHEVAEKEEIVEKWERYQKKASRIVKGIPEVLYTAQKL